MQRQLFDLEDKFPLIGFYGTWLPAYITSMGIVVANATCIPNTEAYVEEEASNVQRRKEYSTGVVVGFIFAGLVGLTLLAAAFYVGFAFGYC